MRISARYDFLDTIGCRRQLSVRAASLVNQTDSYPFKNIGSIPVSILRTEASCDCTTAKLTKSTYGPGESGEVAVTFRFGDREGEQSKMVKVYTDEPAMAGYRLLLHVGIPVAATVAPRLLFWRERGPYEPKMVTIATKTDGPLKLASMDEPSGAFQLQARPLDNGRGYAISVVPLQSDKELRSELTVTLETPGGRLLHYKVFLRCTPRLPATVP